jgi:hypothetical protein
MGKMPMKIILSMAAWLTPVLAGQKIYRIMPVGDSVTEGGASFSNWRCPLWERLCSAGDLIEHDGSRKRPSRIGDLNHGSYGGKNPGFLAATLPSDFQETSGGPGAAASGAIKKDWRTCGTGFPTSAGGFYGRSEGFPDAALSVLVQFAKS